MGCFGSQSVNNRKWAKEETKLMLDLKFIRRGFIWKIVGILKRFKQEDRGISDTSESSERCEAVCEFVAWNLVQRL